jgi:hypothetical protein
MFLSVFLKQDGLSRNSVRLIETLWHYNMLILFAIIMRQARKKPLDSGA